MFLSRNSQVLLERERERSVCVCCPRSHRWNRKENDGRSNRIHTDGESRRSLLIKAGLKGDRRYSFGFGALRRLLLCACVRSSSGEEEEEESGREGRKREREGEREKGFLKNCVCGFSLVFGRFPPIQKPLVVRSFLLFEML